MNSSNQKRIGIATLVALAVVFIVAVMASNSLLRGLRIDLTQNRLYTLSEGTRSLLNGLDQPINLYYFFSDQETGEAQFLRDYATRVQEMLEEFADRANGNIVLSVIDPVPFSEDEDRAAQFGLQPVSLGALGDSVYFGLAGTNGVGDEEIIPFFQSSKENFLEYDLARLVYSLSNRDKPVIALYAGLPVSGGFDPATQQPTQPWAAVEQAQQLFEVRTLAEGFESIGEDVEVLWLIHPAGLSEASLYAIDQFVMRGGRLLAFVDPVAESAGGGNPMMGQSTPNMSTLEPLFSAWGIEFDPSRVTADERLALSVNAGAGQRPIRHIALIGLNESVINQDEIITGGLASINVGVPGSLTLSDASTLTMTPLLSSSEDSGEIPAAQFQFLQDPSTLFDSYSRDGMVRIIAARFDGTLQSAYPDGSPLEGGDGAPHLSDTAAANLILVADVDLLGDRLWVQAQSFLGQRILTAFASNADFLVNALDNLSGSAELIGLRSRASFSRPFERVEELQLAADVQFRATEQQLEAELDGLERNLGELQAAREDTNSILMTPEQERELQRFLDEQVRIRRELRNVRLNLNRDIEQLGTLLKVANIALVPLGVLLFLLARVFVGRRSGS
jgi:ABC-type uncharacterized transport system involved in gliding motility auxiliary subunit